MWTSILELLWSILNPVGWIFEWCLERRRLSLTVFLGAVGATAIWRSDMDEPWRWILSVTIGVAAVALGALWEFVWKEM